MSAINRLPTVSQLATSDLVAMFSQSLGNDAAVTLATLVTFLQAQMTSSGSLVAQYANPNATGFTVTVAPPVAGENMFLLMTPGGAYAAGTIVLPTPVDGQQVLVHSRQAVTALTVGISAADAANGVSSSGAPTTIAAGGFFRMRYDAVNKLWCRIA